MGALTQARMQRAKAFKRIALPLAASQSVFQGGIACVDTSSKTVKKGASGNGNLVKIGEFAETLDNSAGTGSVNVLVDLDEELEGRWYDNATGAGAATLASNFYDDVYIQDDHTVTTTSSSNSKAGRCWGVDALKGVLVVSNMKAL